MKTNYLFPNCFKIYGWIILIPSLIVGALSLVFEIEPTALEFDMPALFVDEFMGQNKLAGTVNNNILNEIVGVLIILSSIFVAFSKEKEEDEYILKIRLESLVWAVYVNYGILLISLLFILICCCLRCLSVYKKQQLGVLFVIIPSMFLSVA